MTLTTKKKPKKADRSLADKCISFIEKLTIDDDGVIVRVKLRQWQKDWIRALFSEDEAGKRRYKKSFLALPRGQGKTSLLGLVVVFCLVRLGRSQEIYSASGEREQAALVFEVAKGCIERDPVLSTLIKVTASKKMLEYPAKGSKYQALSSDSSHPHGLKPSVCIFDEVHVFPNRKLHDALITGLGKRHRNDTLIVYITTAGDNKFSFCYELWQQALEIKAGTRTDATFLPWIYAAEPGDDWKSEETWYKAMPALGDFYSIDHIRTEFQAALDSPYYETVFKNWYLNLWTDKIDSWLSLERWEKLAFGYDPETKKGQTLDIDDLRGLPMYVGIDLSSKTDLTAVCFLWVKPDGTFVTKCLFFVPEVNAAKRSRTDKVPYVEWIGQGWMVTTPGDYVDQDVILETIRPILEAHDTKTIGIDAWQASSMLTRLANEGYDARDVRPNFSNFNGPTKELERLILAGRIIHDGNPCQNWCIQNVVLDTDGAGYVRPSKKKIEKTQRIDGVYALVMSMAMAMNDIGDEPFAMLMDLSDDD